MGRSASTPNPPANILKGILQINDSVRELYRGPGIPEVEIIFFHGLPLADDFESSWWRTWLSRDGTVIWPKDWLSERFPNARILSISYDSYAKKTAVDPDWFLLGKTLVDDIILSPGSKIGQECPVVLVGHSLGGNVIKLLLPCCMKRAYMRNPDKHKPDSDRINTFLKNCKGLFFYGTPHLRLTIPSTYRLPTISSKSSTVRLMKNLARNLPRINEEFRGVTQQLQVKTFAVGESLPTGTRGMKVVVVEEASARFNNYNDGYSTASNADHFTVCRPESMKSDTFVKLEDFIASILTLEKAESLQHRYDKRYPAPQINNTSDNSASTSQLQKQTAEISDTIEIPNMSIRGPELSVPSPPDPLNLQNNGRKKPRFVHSFFGKAVLCGSRMQVE